MANFLKGLIVGIANITPGLSGSVLLIIFNLYDKCIYAVGNFFRDIKRHFLFLLPIAIGIIIGTVLFSNVIKFFLEVIPMSTTYAFFGFILGTIPSLFRQANKKGFQPKYLIVFIITIIIGLILLAFANVANIQAIDLNKFELIILGLILAASTIIPGISGTVLLTMIGFYDIYLTAISEINITLLIPILIGFGIGAIVLSKIINFCLNKNYGMTYYAIIGFVITTMPSILKAGFGFNINTLISLIVLIIAFIISYYFSNKFKENV